MAEEKTKKGSPERVRLEELLKNKPTLKEALKAIVEQGGTLRHFRFPDPSDRGGAFWELPLEDPFIQDNYLIFGVYESGTTQIISPLASSTGYSIHLPPQNKILD